MTLIRLGSRFDSCVGWYPENAAAPDGSTPSSVTLLHTVSMMLSRHLIQQKINVWLVCFATLAEVVLLRWSEEPDIQVRFLGVAPFNKSRTLGVSRSPKPRLLSSILRAPILER